MMRGGATETVPARTEIALDVAAFSITAAFAYIEQWTAKDMAWGLWSSSLFVGYVSLLVASVSGVRTYHPFAFVFSVFYSAYLAVFFTVHFGGFHLGHAIFLNTFLPLIPDMTDQISVEMILKLLRTAYTQYWPLILGSFLRAIPAMVPDHTLTQGQMIFRPYVNVLRMHLFIFILLFLKNMQLQQWTLMVLLLLYFFPWRVLRHRART